MLAQLNNLIAVAQQNVCANSAKTVALASNAQANTATKVTKSSIVRAQIAIAKQNNATQATVIAWAIANLAMQKQLATAYVKNNWEKVVI